MTTNPAPTQEAEPSTSDETASACCPPSEQASCCEPADKASCCGGEQGPSSCGCNSLGAVLTRTDGPWIETRAELLAFVERRVADRETAEDIVHDLLERLHPTDPATVTNFHAWLYRSARNAIVDHYRKRGAIPVDVVDDELAGLDREASDNEPEEAVRELSHCLRPLVNQLPDEYRDAVTLVDLDGLTHQAAAQQVGVSTSGMKSRVQRGRKKLAARLHDCCVIDTHGGTIDDYTPRHAVCACNADPATGSTS